MANIMTKNGEVQFAYIYDGRERLGDVTLFPEGNACVMNEWSGLMQWFDSTETGHDDALHYIKTMMTTNPTFIG